ncbi:Putative kinase-like protein TMKL1 [Striga hermonthica]|uniref:Kinase-like protein TMKL1 n=1 Tax=Striga hermonthica TaxID=68872 RepID=A0A9N7RCL8_STRHE|nr:Putative kinase-like protein TMKL1 [Striga hermonthica]
MAALKLLPLCISLLLSLTHSASDVDLLLQKIKPSLQGTAENLLLSSWNTSIPLCQWRGLKWALAGENASSPPPCDGPTSPQWTNIYLHRSPYLQLVSLQLPSANLTGIIPKEIGQLANLQSLYLGVNALSGPIPLELGYSSSLSDIDLSHNQLRGPLPASIWNLCGAGLVSLQLHGNSLSGTVPDPALPQVTSCKNLKSLDLGQNLFTGNFPEFILGFHGLQQLDLGDNMLSGSIPDAITGLKLEKLNLSHNNFTGVLPSFGGSKFGMDAFEGNSPALCGPPLRDCNLRSGLSPGAVAGLVIGMMTGAVVLVSLLIGYFQGKRKKKLHDDEFDEDNEFEEVEDEEAGKKSNGGDGKLVLFQGGEHLTTEDVLNATGQVMEKTSYGTVYKAKLADGGTIALRLLREGTCKDRASCLPVIKQLGRIRHENLIPLRAFYQGRRGEKLLIYDYMSNKTLYELLHESRVGKPVLNWARRHKIALGIARGLAHLHGLDPPITHGNVRSKTVLVDDFFVARLNEFGLDKMMVSSVADDIVVQAKADGYRAPELQRMAKCGPRTDVYAFGIVLLEILLGRRPRGGGSELPSLVKAAVLEETTMEVFDVEILKGVRNPMEEGLVQALKLAMGCCAPVGPVRPTMEEVVRQLEENRPRNRSALYSPADTRSGSVTPF